MVDIKRDPSILKKKRMRQSAYAVAGVAAIIMVTVFVSQLKPAAPEVARSAVWIDAVKRGPFTRAVRGAGRLVPEDIRWIPATTAGRVERIVLRPGAQVRPGTVIVEMSNPQLEQQVTQARLGLQSAEAALANRRSELDRQLLTQQSDLANLEAQLQQARNLLEAEERLNQDGLSAEITLKSRRSDVEVLTNQVNLAKQSLKMAQDSLESQMAP